MLIKLGIIACVMILAVMVIVNETTLFPQATETVNTAIDDTTKVTLTATEALEHTINDTVTNVMDTTIEVGDQVTEEIEHVTEQSKNSIESGLEDFNPFESISDVFE